MISIIGLGGAGNQIANEATKLGFQTGAINFSQRDLDSAKDVKLKQKLVGSEGVGKNRDEAIKLLNNNWESVLSFVKDNFSHTSNEIIMLAFSTGGGSGSGISPMLLDILTNEIDKVFVALPIIPDKSEVLVNQINCLSTFEELSNLDISIFPIDNENVKTKYNSIGKNTLYRNANSVSINLISKIISYTDKYSRNGNIDRKDLLQIFNTKGIGLMSEVNIAKLNEGKLSDESVIKIIQDSWSNSIFTNTNFNQVLRAGIIFDGQEELMEYIQYEKIFNKFKNGMPIDLFEGNYHDQDGTVISILTGLSWCNTRLKEIEHIIEERGKNAEIALSETENQDYVSPVTKFQTRIRMPNKEKVSVSDIISKYRR